MFHNKKSLSFERGFLLLVVIINVLIIKTAYTVTEDLYWLLLLSIPMLFFATYFERRVSKQVINDVTINSNNAKDHNKDNLISRDGLSCDELKVSFGNKYCTQPYLSSIICFESVSSDDNNNLMPEEIVLSEDYYHTENMTQSLNDSVFSDDCIWRIGAGYAGCRDNDFNFNAEAFKANAVKPQVKMIELRLSGFNNQAAKPARNISYSKQTNSGTYKDLKSGHTAFCNPESLVIFLDSLKQLSGKKPVGIRLRITDKKEFHEICYAFCKTHIVPDFIVVEGSEKDHSFRNNVPVKPGLPLFEALQLVSKTLELYGLTKETKIIAAAEIYTAFDILKLRALGADAISMRNRFTRSDISGQKDDAGNTTWAQQVMVRFRSDILNSTMNVIRSWGYRHIKDITLSSLFRSLNTLQSTDANKKSNHQVGAITERKTYRFRQKSNYEKNTGSELFLN